MRTLYSGSGAQDFTIERSLDQAVFQQWPENKKTVVKLLRAYKYNFAAELLETLPFQLFPGTNYFGDEFFVLILDLEIDEYTKNFNHSQSIVYSQIAKTFLEVNLNIRFIAIRLINEKSMSVDSPKNDIYTRETVRKALEDSDLLLAQHGPQSAIDRVHTALHGYLEDLTGVNKESITYLFKKLRDTHAAFVSSKKDEQSIRIMNSLSGCIDAINGLRNTSSLAHPNNKLLGEPEAQLMINCSKTIFSYISEKIQTEEKSRTESE